MLLISIAVPFCLKAQLKEIRAIEQQLSTIQDSVIYVDALNRLGMLYHLNNIDSCFYFSRKALPVAERLNYDKGRADALNNLGIVSMLKHNTGVALKYFNSALTLYRMVGDTSNECQALMNIAISFATDNKMAEYRQYITSSYQLASRLKKDSILTYIILNNINDTSLVKPDSAFALLRRAKSIALKYKDERGLIAATEFTGEVLARAGHAGEALDTLKTALQMAEAFGDEYERISLLEDLGDNYAGVHDTDAIGFYMQALAIATKSNYRGLQLELTQKLYDYYASKKDAVHSADYAAMLIAEYKDYQQQLHQFGVDYMDYAIKTSELQNLKSDRNRNISIIIMLSVLSAIIIVLLLFVLRGQRARKKYVELLQQRNEQAGNRYAELQSKNEFNNRLISILAHDFRQPLAAVKGMMSLLKEPGSLSEQEISLLVNKIETSSDTSLEIFDNILHWIKKQVSGFIYEPASMQLNELVDEAAKSLQYITDKFNITVINNITDATIIQADKEMLQFVNRNLIHNAVKFSPANASITVSALKKGNEIIVSVKDEGKGMSKEKIDSLFNIFSKRQYASDKEKGSGVALVICKDFLERMQGRIWAESEQGKGSTFLYSLPLND